MKLLAALPALCVGFSSVWSLPALAQTERPAMSSVPRGTAVPVVLDEELNGYRDIAGSAVRFRVVAPVLVDGKMIADTGDTGTGIVQDIGRGLLKISIESIKTYCGTTLDMDHETLGLIVSLASSDAPGVAPGVSSIAQKGTPYRAVTMHLQRVCNAK